MQNILITGGSGNIGQAVLRHLKKSANQKVIIASRNAKLNEDEVLFDFEDLHRSAAALQNIHILFLLRPPHISDVKKYFAPQIALCKKSGVQHIVFLSVQGADKAGFIPHAKIEKLIRESGISYTFIRPSYFMQNLTTTFLNDLEQNNEVVVPAGKAPFLWVDVADVGRAIAMVLQHPSQHQNKAYTITGSELLSFKEVAHNFI